MQSGLSHSAHICRPYTFGSESSFPERDHTGVRGVSESSFSERDHTAAWIDVGCEYIQPPLLAVS
jgi:hypothetical protein